MYYRLTIALIFLFVLSSCNPDKQTKVDQANVTFITDDASRLFFKNIRQTAYELQEMEAAKLNIYRYKKREQSANIPLINLAIVDNWRYDQAYLLLEPNEQLSDSELWIKWEDAEDNGEIRYAKGNKTDQVAFADKIYDRIQQGATFSIQVKDTWVPFLNSEKARESFRIMMFDYYRLVKRI